SPKPQVPSGTKEHTPGHFGWDVILRKPHGNLCKIRIHPKIGGGQRLRTYWNKSLSAPNLWVRTGHPPPEASSTTSESSRSFRAPPNHAHRYTRSVVFRRFTASINP